MSEACTYLSKASLEQSRLRFVSGIHNDQPGFALQEHSQLDLWQADWVLSGEMEYKLYERRIVLQENEILFIPPSTRHGLRSTRGVSYRAIKFEAAFPPLQHKAIAIKLAQEGLLVALLAREVFEPSCSPPCVMDY